MEYSVGKKIAELRRAKGWTQATLAEKLGVSDKAVSKWESDRGFPEITQFPVLASIFDVSLDYLMMGKAPEKEVVIMSKIELCAKNDDTSMLENINIATKDETGKTIVDYAKKYKSKKVLTALINKYGFNRMFPAKRTFDTRTGKYITNRYSDEEFIEVLYYAVCTNTLSQLDKDQCIKNGYGCVWGYLSFLEGKVLESNAGQELFDLLLNDKDITGETLDFLFSKHENHVRIRNPRHSRYDSSEYICCSVIWGRGIAYLIECAIKSGNHAVFEKYYTFIKTLNFKSEENRAAAKGENRESRENVYRTNPIVGVHVSTIEWLLENGQIKLAEELDLFNRRFSEAHVSADTVRLAKLKASKNVTEDELTIQSAIHEGILKIDKILPTKNLDLVNKALQKYPIHFAELMIDWYNREDWNALLEYDKEYRFMYHDPRTGYSKELSKIELSKEAFGKYILNYWVSDEAEKYADNGGHLYIYEAGKKRQLIEWYNEYETQSEFPRRKGVKSVEELDRMFKACKKRIVDDLAMQLDKESTTAGLTKEYFYKELDKGNREIVIIKLCVLLEAVLKNDFRYDGAFSDMLDRYCDEKLRIEDWDGGDWSDYKTIKVLNNLRIMRNNIVHAEKNDVLFTIEDIQYCIEYICKMN